MTAADEPDINGAGEDRIGLFLRWPDAGQGLQEAIVPSLYTGILRVCRAREPSESGAMTMGSG